MALRAVRLNSSPVTYQLSSSRLSTTVYMSPFERCKCLHQSCENLKDQSFKTACWNHLCCGVMLFPNSTVPVFSSSMWPDLGCWCECQDVTLLCGKGWSALGNTVQVGVL